MQALGLPSGRTNRRAIRIPQLRTGQRCQLPIFCPWGALFVRPKNEHESKTKTAQVRPADTWKLLLCTTNSRTTPKLGNQLMAHAPRVLSLSEVGEASAELVSDDFPLAA